MLGPISSTPPSPKAALIPCVCLFFILSKIDHAFFFLWIVNIFFFFNYLNWSEQENVRLCASFLVRWMDERVAQHHLRKSRFIVYIVIFQVIFCMLIIMGGRTSLARGFRISEKLLLGKFFVVLVIFIHTTTQTDLEWLDSYFFFFFSSNTHKWLLHTAKHISQICPIYFFFSCFLISRFVYGNDFWDLIALVVSFNNIVSWAVCMNIFIGKCLEMQQISL